MSIFLALAQLVVFYLFALIYLPVIVVMAVVTAFLPINRKDK
jgi:hypothetical protein